MGPKRAPKPRFDIKVSLPKANGGRTIVECRANQSIFAQGDLADAIFYVKKGKVKLTVLSDEGKEAVVAILKEDDFFGEATTHPFWSTRREETSAAASPVGHDVLLPCCSQEEH
jgi:CRP-like cAMP-binding protein